MGLSISLISFLSRDYDEAIDFFVNKIGFKLVEDTKRGGTKRWVVLSAGEDGAKLLIAKAIGAEQIAAIGNQMGGRVGFFLSTADFDESYLKMRNCGVEFLEEPRNEPYGKVVVFNDLYGNKWDLLEKFA